MKKWRFQVKFGDFWKSVQKNSQNLLTKSQIFQEDAPHAPKMNMGFMHIFEILEPSSFWRTIEKFYFWNKKIQKLRFSVASFRLPLLLFTFWRKSGNSKLSDQNKSCKTTTKSVTFFIWLDKNLLLTHLNLLKISLIKVDSKLEPMNQPPTKPTLCYWVHSHLITEFQNLTRCIFDYRTSKFWKSSRLKFHMDLIEASKDILDQFDIKINEPRSWNYQPK